MKIEPIRWLHLSDLHLKGLKSWDRVATLDALLRHVEELKDEGLAPDLVFVTGDLAYSGKHKEFEQAELFLRRLAEVVELEPRERFFVVPGNHDVDRAAIGPADDAIFGGLTSQGAVEKVLTHRPTMELLSGRLRAFYAFTERLLGGARGWRDDRPWRVDVREIHGVEVAILQLNSAWASGGANDQGRLLLGEAQIREAFDEAAGTRLRIALVHHPLDHLTDFDYARAEALLGANDGAHFLLRGHLHRSRATSRLGPDGTLVELAAGATYNADSYPRRYLLGEVDPAKGEGRSHFFRYSEEGRGFWTTDTTAYEGARKGSWTFELQADLQTDEAQAAAPALTEARAATLADRYRMAVVATHGTVRFVGFADRRPRRMVQVPELFVPLRLQVRRSEKESRTTSSLLQRLVQPNPRGNASRLVVLGDPGSGKTTLCRFAAVALAGEAKLDGFSTDRELLPLFLPFREYVRTCRELGDRSLLAFLEEQARNHLLVPLPEGFFERFLEAGNAVLLLDGLDEVGSAGEREEMRERLQAFCLAYPKTAVLVTSRVAGYDDAPLAHFSHRSLDDLADSADLDEGDLATVVQAFRHLTLEPFSDNDLRNFVSHWYSVQEPDDPQVRDRGIAELSAALDARPRLRELARNPMLATLIALVHRYEAHLPGERAKLYELCVKTMVETWPAARKRRFQPLDEGLQLAYLENLALHMQKARKPGVRKAGVTIEREELISALAEIVARNNSQAPESAKSLATRWVRFLEEGTGLLVEQRPGVFAFFHLSLMEYLAARALAREEQPLEVIIAERYGEAVWREVCLLAIGGDATNKAFLDRLYGLLMHQRGFGKWPFLLQALREEATFDDSQRETIVTSVAHGLLKLWPKHWEHDQKLFDELCRLSLRHSHWASSWRIQQLVHATGESLRAIVALLLESKEFVTYLDGRSDRSEIAKCLINFWPGHEIGLWAARNSTSAAALEWGQFHLSNSEFAWTYSLAAINQETYGESLAPALVTQLASLTADFWIRSERSRRLLERSSRPGGEGITKEAELSDQKIRIALQPASWHSAEFLSAPKRPKTLPYFQRHFAKEFSKKFDQHLAHTKEFFFRYFSLSFDLAFGDHFYSHFNSFSRYFSRFFTEEYNLELAQEFDRYFDRPFIRNNTVGFARKFKRNFSPSLSSSPETCEGIRLSPPTSKDLPPDIKSLRHLVQRLRISLAEEDLFSAVSRLAVEVWGGAIVASRLPEEQRTPFVALRVRNAWLLQIWPALDHNLAAHPKPGALACYLALGWTQASTTHNWPATGRWIEILSGPPPEHWLPRSQFHFCWLLYDNDDAEHRAGLKEALEAGRNDPNAPGVADDLWQVAGELVED